MKFKILLNTSATRSIIVEEAYTAKFIGSGVVDVLSTPMMIALMENAALDAVQTHLAEGWTTVGTKVDIEHLRATPVGEKVTAEATLIKQEGRALEFSVAARDNQGIIGQGSHKRFIIDLEKFMQKNPKNKIAYFLPAISFSISSISLGTSLLKTSHPSFVMRTVSSMRMSSSFSG